MNEEKRLTEKEKGQILLMVLEESEKGNNLFFLNDQALKYLDAKMKKLSDLIEGKSVIRGTINLDNEKPLTTKQQSKILLMVLLDSKERGALFFLNEQAMDSIDEKINKLKDIIDGKPVNTYRGLQNNDIPVVNIEVKGPINLLKLLLEKNVINDISEGKNAIDNATVFMDSVRVTEYNDVLVSNAEYFVSIANRELHINVE